MLYGNRDSSSVIFLEALAGLKDKHLGRFEIYHFLDQEEQDIELFNGMLDRERLRGGDPGTGARRGRGRRLVHLRARADDGRRRRRAARPQHPEGAHPHRALHRRPAARSGRRAKLRSFRREAEGVTVAVTLDGRTRRVPFTAGNILDSARAAGLPAPFACKAGVCATCRAKVTKGKVEMAARYGLTDEEVADGYVLTCQSVPLGDGVAVDYDA